MNNVFCKIFLTILIFVTWFSNAQKYSFVGGKESQTIKFKLINNLIILPIEVNGTELTFILDSGVSSPVIFNMKSSDSLKFNELKTVKLRGLGKGESVEAVLSKNNKIKFGDIFTLHQNIYIIYNEKLDLSGKLGFPVNGIIGYDILKDFVVTINYISKKITFTKPENYEYKKCRSCETFDLFFYKNKPYINAEITIESPELKTIPVQLLIDSGGTDSLWLFVDEEKGITIPDNSFEDFIGEGISGSIFGMRSRIKSFALKSFVIENPNVAYLDSLSTIYAKRLKTRNGSLGGNILKRFKVIFDYPNSKLTLKKNRNFNDEFTYNMSGIELIYGGQTLVKEIKRTTFGISDDPGHSSANTITFDYTYSFSFKPVYKIAYLRKNSPAKLVGLRVGDYLIRINGKQAYNYKMSEITLKFYTNEDKYIRLTIDRDGQEMEFSFKPKNLLQKKHS